MKLSEEDIDRNKNLYDRVYAEQDMNLDAWGSEANKLSNFLGLIGIQLISGHSLGGSSCLDVGCGTGDLYQMLKDPRYRQLFSPIGSYTGTDIYRPSLERAREKHPSGRFLEVDILDWDTSESFDFAFASGSLSTDMEQDNYNFLGAMVARMWELTRFGVVFNVLIDHDSANLPGAFFYNIPRVAAICEQVIGVHGNMFHQTVRGTRQEDFYLWRARIDPAYSLAN